MADERQREAAYPRVWPLTVEEFRGLMEVIDRSQAIGTPYVINITFWLFFGIIGPVPLVWPILVTVLALTYVLMGVKIVRAWMVMREVFGPEGSMSRVLMLVCWAVPSMAAVIMIQSNHMVKKRLEGAGIRAHDGQTMRREWRERVELELAQGNARVIDMSKPPTVG